MSDLRNNSILGALLAAVLGVMGVGVAADQLVQPNYPEKAGFLPEVTLDSGGGGSTPSGPPDFGRLFADQAQLTELVARGERVMAQCRSCHTFEAGGANGIGPNLHDVFGRAVASHGGYEYSPAMQEHGGNWDYLALNDFLRSPASDVRGTKMAFAGLRNDEERVAMIAYLRSISPNNVPLPAPLPEAAPAEVEAAAPAEGEGATPAPAEGETKAPTPPQ
ncbi:MAG TPA: cytochrome c family protein [Candidatus Binatia bacterium]|nr:cytochrome c family protein [Candidatus Binatia bacterium]